MVMPENAMAVPSAADSVLKTRLLPFASSDSLSKPGPLIVSASVIASSPVVRGIVVAFLNVPAESKLIVLAELTSRFASRIACRSDPAPASLALMTVKVVGTSTAPISAAVPQTRDTPR